MKAGLAVVVAVASASVNTHVKVETVNFEEDQLNTEKNITETFAWKEKSPPKVTKKATAPVMPVTASASQNIEGGSISKEEVNELPSGALVAMVKELDKKEPVNNDEFLGYIAFFKPKAETFFANHDVSEKTFVEAFDKFRFDARGEFFHADKFFDEKQEQQLDQITMHLMVTLLIEKIIEGTFGEFFPDGIQPQDEGKIIDFKTKVAEKVKLQIQKAKKGQLMTEVVTITQEGEEEIMQLMNELVKKKIEKEKGPGEGEEEVLDLTKLNNNKLNTFWEELTKTKELVLKNTEVFKLEAKTYLTNYQISVKNNGDSTGNVGAGFSLEYDENKYSGKLYLILTDTSTDMTTSALALYAMVSWALKVKGNLKIEENEQTKGYEEYEDRVSSTLGLLELKGGKTVNEWHETLADLTALPSQN